MTIKSFREIIAWQKAHELVLEVYKVTSDFPRLEEFNLTSQLRRCIVSIPSNITEGFARKSLKDSKRFYIIAEASLEEAKYQILLARDLSYVTLDKYSDLILKADEVGKLLSRWKNSQKY